MLEKLTKEQEEQMYKHRKEYIDFIVNNVKHQPKDLELTPELRDDINWVCKKAGLKPPKFVFISKSYLEEKLMINAVFQIFGAQSSILDQVVSQVWSQVQSQVWNQVQSQVRSQVRSQVEGQVQSQVWDQVEGQVRSQVRSQVEGQVWSQVYNQVANKIENKKLEWVEHGFGLPWNSGWFSFYTFFQKIGIVSSPDFERYFGLVKNHGLWSIQFFNDWCIVTQLPKIIRRDNENRLHSTDGPCIEWRNGEKNYYIHGIYFEPQLWEEVVSGKNADPTTILKIQNQEQKQAALSVIPIKTLLEKSCAYKIDEYLKPEPKLSKKLVKDYKKLDFSHPIELYQIQNGAARFGIDEEIKILHYFCPSTGREYFDFVPPNINSAVKGISWKFGISEEDYINRLVVET